MNMLKPYQPYLLSLLRAVTGLVLFSYGTQKILGMRSPPRLRRTRV